MPYYDFNSGGPITSVNIEIVHAGSGDTYSFESLYLLPSIPVDEQIIVYGRDGPDDPETLYINNTDYVIDGSNIVFNAAVSGGQVVIRRWTNLDLMAYRIADGAKLTAEELNTCFHQILFAMQERTYSAANISNNYTLSPPVVVWDDSTAYVIGNVVSIDNELYRCIDGNTNQPPDSSPLYWEVVDYTNPSFLIVGGTNPVVFDLTNITPGKALVWNGTSFEAVSFTGNLSDMDDVDADDAEPGDILIRGINEWVARTPSFDITQTNILFADRAFYANVANTSYTNDDTEINVSSKSFLSKFKRISDSKWVVADVPTVYHVIKSTMPTNEDPESFFDRINDAVGDFSDALSNPIKAKVIWRPGYSRRNLTDDANSDKLAGTKDIFWGDPSELYHYSGYSAANLGHHGILNGGTKYHSSPWYYRELNGVDEVTFISRLWSQGVTAFYLSVPECVTSCFADLPAMNGESYFNPSVSTITDAFRAIGTEVATSYRDYYLLGLRDMFSAGAISEPADETTTKNRDGVARLRKTQILDAEYSGFESVYFRRHEDIGESQSLALWKIPKQIIYYNKHALGLADKTTSALNTGSSFARNTVRFAGEGKFIANPGSDYPNSTITVNGLGKILKYDQYLADWCSKWEGDSDVTGNYKFNEADIDWVLYDVQRSSGTCGLFRLYSHNPANSIWLGDLSGDGATTAKHYFPWDFRPNDIRDGSSANKGYIGNHMLNIDANRLFSDAANFIPDPVDNYVFRIVMKSGISAYLVDGSNNQLKTSIIVEHGFAAHPFSGRGVGRTLKSDIFRMGTIIPESLRALSRMDTSKVTVRVLNECVETVDDEDRVVVTLCITVPRAKSIGYSKIFRKYRPSGSGPNYPKFDDTAADTDRDSGPWNWFVGSNTINSGSGLPTLYTGGAGSVVSDTTVITTNSSVVPVGTDDWKTQMNYIAGRNECAVKFTRLGIPGNLWLRVSILNSDGCAESISSSGYSLEMEE